jgi:hypothetical protein
VYQVRTNQRHHRLAPEHPVPRSFLLTYEHIPAKCLSYHPVPTVLLAQR